MGLFSKKTEGGALDVIRCDEAQYLVWKWRPSGEALSTRKENAIRWGSSLRVKDGEVAVFVYKQENGPSQDFIEGPFDETIKTANFPVISSILGMAFAGQSPFQAEIYFINLEGNIKVEFRVPYFDVSDPRFSDFPVRTTVGGSYRFNITDYKTFIHLHRLVNFDIEQFSENVRDAVLKQIKGVVANAPAENNIPVLQIERKLLDINALIEPRLRRIFAEDFGVNLRSLDLTTIEIDKVGDGKKQYEELRAVTANLEMTMRQSQNEINIKNLADTQALNTENMGETLRIQREQAERFAQLQTQQQFLGAHQINQQTAVLSAAANNLGAMGEMNTGSGGGGSGGGFNPVGVMAGMAVGGAMGGQMANMMNNMGQNMQQPGMVPPPPPVISYHVSINGQNTGPFNLPQLQQMAQLGQLPPNTHVWKAGMANWELAGNVTELASLFAPSAPPPPPPAPPQSI
jgi:membrane protease subunit (stomatin/prohibitin family)